MIKHSKQRDAIMNQLRDRYDHPTAETLYAELKEVIPNLSMATVYRNLKQLHDWGEIISITTDGATRYDARTNPHSHFFCRECGAVTDLDYDSSEILELGRRSGIGQIEGCSANFYGVCSGCLQKHS